MRSAPQKRGAVTPAIERLFRVEIPGTLRCVWAIYRDRETAEAHALKLRRHGFNAVVIGPRGNDDGDDAPPVAA